MLTYFNKSNEWVSGPVEMVYFYGEEYIFGNGAMRVYTPIMKSNAAKRDSSMRLILK